MRAGFLAIAALTLAVPCAAQTAARPGVAPLTTAEDRIAALLQSADAREQAWGAWYAGRDHRREMVPLLQQVVAARVRATALADAAARDVALDALIQMKATLDPELLTLVYEQRPAEALILASHAKNDATEFLMEILRTANAEPWFAAANLLLEARASGYAATLLRNVRIEAVVHVTDDGGPGWGSGRGAGGWIGCGILGRSPGLPPWPSYALTTSARSGVAVLAIGPRAMYYERRVMPAGQGRNGSTSSIAGPSSQERLVYIAALLSEDPARLPVREFEPHSVMWRGDAALQLDIEGIRADIAARLQHLFDRLESQDLLSADELRELRTAHMIELRVEDHRTRRN